MTTRKITHAEDMEDAMVALADFLSDTFQMTDEQVEAFLYLPLEPGKTNEQTLNRYVGPLDFRHNH